MLATLDRSSRGVGWAVKAVDEEKQLVKATVHQMLPRAEVA
jgi:hypothetical protein